VTAPTRPPLSGAERRLRVLLRVLAVLFAGAVPGFFLRPAGTVGDLNAVGAFFGLGVLPAAEWSVASDFWLVLAVANMATISACAWLAGADVRGRRALVYPIVVSKLTSSAAGLLLFLGRAPAFPYLAATLVDLPIALALLVALRAAPPPAAASRTGLAA
jgi:hypothetical protein